VKEDEVYSLKITSGTTARPKIFTYTENGYVAAAYNLVEALKLTSKDVVAAIAPVTQGLGQLVGFGAATVAGCKVVLIPHFDAAHVVQIMAKQKITVGVAVPTMISKLLTVPQLKRQDLRSLRAFQLGGALLPPVLAERFENSFGCKIINTYGSSEGPIPFSTRLNDSDYIRRETVGSLHPGHEVRIVDSRGKSLSHGEIGEIMSRGPSTGSGYFDDSEANREAFTQDGWFRHGDLGYIDDQGIGRIVGRKKEIIIRGGQNISPKEIEEAILLMPEIAEVVVIGLPDPVYGERVCACVVLKESYEPLTLKDITAFLEREGMAPYKLPERMEILRDFPRSGGGKIRKDLLVKEILKKQRD
jgi:non-ribosomal peptide synthetase component E (peptide arylation enzyme)